MKISQFQLSETNAVFCHRILCVILFKMKHNVFFKNKSSKLFNAGMGPADNEGEAANTKDSHLI